jgi:ABC-type multidrug transport system ATPase subunit
MCNILEIEGVLHSFGNRQILTDVYLKCQTGEIIGILGQNGTGKSTLLKIVFGTLSATNKNIRINGKWYDKPYQAPGLIAYLPQHRFLPRNISLRQIVNIFITNKPQQQNIFADQHMIPQWKKRTTELSGGELRYFEILLLINTHAKFLLLDEPFSGIEPIYRERITELILENRKQTGFLLTDHDYRSIIDVSSNILLIVDGGLKKIMNVEQLEGYNYVPVGTFTKLDETNNQNRSLLPYEVDKQTLKDIELFDQDKGGLAFSIFNNVQTIGGFQKLDEFLLNPVTDKQVLSDRADAIRFFKETGSKLIKSKAQLDFIEHYISTNIPVLKKNLLDAFIQSWRQRIRPSNDYYIIKTGIQYLALLFHDISMFLKGMPSVAKPVYLSRRFFSVQEIIFAEEITELMHTSGESNISPSRLAAYDHFFRKQKSENVRFLLDFIYEMDVYETVAQAAENYQLSFPVYIDNPTPVIRFQSLFHPLLTKPVANDFEYTDNATLCFLSGANMSGKSTFLKSFGLAFHLAHVGFPVPAKRMETTIFHGLITSINLSDNITKGYSHFYSEVHRVKETALKIKEKGRMMVIFDELFRGTNVKDAEEASRTIISALSKIKNSLFIISTHIVEIADDLNSHPSIIFRCFESGLDGEKPIYNYKLHHGISKERLGMQIVRNERIVEILEEIQRSSDEN